MRTEEEELVKFIQPMMPSVKVEVVVVRRHSPLPRVEVITKEHQPCLSANFAVRREPSSLEEAQFIKAYSRGLVFSNHGVH